MKYVFIVLGIAALIGAILYSYLKNKAKSNLMPNTGSIAKSSDTKKPSTTTVSVSPYYSSGVAKNSYLGLVPITGSQVAVYGLKQFINLGDYPNAIGFLQDGTIVYVGLTNEGTPEENTYYYI